MILQALYDYYERKPEIHAPIGYEKEEIDFLIVIDRQGKFVGLENKRENKRGKPYFVPKAVVRTAATKPNFLWDKIEYITGISKDEKKSKQAKGYNKAFIDKLNRLPNYVNEDAGIKAIQLFYNTNQVSELLKNHAWDECLKISGLMAFQLDGEIELIANHEIVKNYQEQVFLSGKYEEDDLKKLKEYPCLITGEKTIVKRLNTELRLPGSDKNVKIVAFQKKSGFDSYKKEQAYNAPVSIKAEAAYSTALKHLINSSTNKKIVTDTTILYWTEKKTEEVNPEEMFAFLVAQTKDEDNPDKGAQVIESFFNSIFTGQYSFQKTNHFYVLGLAPNAARISVRFWKAPSVEDFGYNIKKHFDDFEIVHGPKDHKYLSLYQILSSTALAYKMDNVLPNLAGAVIESIIDGRPYPRTLMQQCVRRIRAEASKKDQNGKSIQNVNRTRAAILKAYLNRFNKIYNKNEKEITMGLDPNNTNVAYRIGRLFAVLEKIQETASSNLNATIRDRYYVAASTSPITVFPRLLALKNAHLKSDKISKGSKVYYEKLIGEIVSEMSSFPTNLPLNDQAQFALGYYHQRQDFFTKKSEKEVVEIESTNN